MSKGSKQRPAQVSSAQLEANWSKIFNNKTKGSKNDKGKHPNESATSKTENGRDSEN